MRQLVRYEWKKIWGSRLNQLTVLGCCMFLLFCVYSVIAQTHAADEKGNSVYGMEAVKILKEMPTVPVTQENAEQLMQEYLDCTEDPAMNSDKAETNFLNEEVYKTLYRKNREFFSLLTANYQGSSRELNIKEVLQKSMGKDFYKSRSAQLAIELDGFVKTGMILDSQKDYWIKKDEQVRDLKLGSFQFWKDMIDSAGWIMLIMPLICVGIAPMFAGEYQTGAASMLLTMRYGKSRLARAKILTAILYATTVYWGIVLTYAGIYLMIFGPQGGTIPIQAYDTANFISYSLTMWQAVLLVAFLHYGAVLCMTAVTLLLSAVFKNSYGVIIVDFLLVLIPSFLYESSGGYVWKHVLALVPSKISEFRFTDYLAYNIPGKVIGLPAALAVTDAICIVGFILASGYAFKRHQVNK